MFTSATGTYGVAISEDGRHAVWPLERPMPWGWAPEGFEGSREACLAHIASIWDELRLSPDAGTGGR